MASVFKRKGKKSSKWLIAYTNENGKRRVITGAPSKTVTEQIAAKLEDEVALRRRGVINPRVAHYAKGEKRLLVVRNGSGQIVGGHLGDFHAALVNKGTSAKQARMVKNRAEKIIGSCNAERISDLTPSAVQAAIQSLRDDGLSLQTCNHYLRAIKQFYRWLWRDRRVPEDVLAHLSGYNVKLDRRRERRALTDDELVRLIEAAEKGPTILGMCGPNRAMFYRLAVGTGFRVNELKSLGPESFDLDADPPTVTVEAGYSKRRRRDEQEIRRDLAELLRPWLADKAPGEPVFALPDKPPKMMRIDLEAAGVSYWNGAGRVADVHSLRHSFISRLARAGVGVKLAQQLARHSDPALTLNVYTHLSATDRAAALESLPPLEGPSGQAGRKQPPATGTDDARG